MEFKKLTYIALAALLTASCTKELSGDTLNPDGTKTALEVAAVASVEAPQTKAAGKEFANGDQIVAYLRHVTWDGTDNGARTLVNDVTGTAPRLVTFTKGSAASSAYDFSTLGDIKPIGTNTALGLTADNTMQTTDLTVSEGLFWDDFSVSSNDGANDLRTSGHYLESYYAYCYNGGTPASLNETTGVLGWAVQTNQNSSDNFRNSDLLWSAEQRPISYSHATFNGGAAHGKLLLPFTHALSKVTVNLSADAGFADGFKFTATTVTLKNKNTSCTVDGPVTSMTGKGTPGDIIMKQVDASTAKSASYSAIIVPSALTAGEDFATITDADGNDYVIKVTAAMLANATAANGNLGWGTRLSEGSTLSGAHYVLNVTLSKQTVDATAFLRNWDDVTSGAAGDIVFHADVKSNSNISGAYTQIDADGSAFDIWRLAASSTDPAGQDKSNGQYGAKAATAVYDNDNDDDETEDTWVNTPKLYWADNSTSFFFRALTKLEAKSAQDPSLAYKSVGGSLAATQGTDLIWGTTAAHTGTEADGTTTHDYAAGAPINPRTGNVPMAFEHVMSKVSFTLTTTDAEIDIAGARISVSGLYDGATVEINDGSMSAMTASGAKPVSGLVSADVIMLVPQSLKFMADGTTPRTGKVLLYNATELTKIYSDGTSDDNGGSYETYYTPSLDRIEYDAAGAIAYNATLTGHKNVGDEKEPATYYTKEDADAYNAELDGAVKAGDVKTPAVVYTSETAAAYNAQLPGAWNAETENPEGGHYTSQEIIDHNAGLSGAVAPGQVQTPAVYYDADTAAEYNATLPGHKNVGDEKTPQVLYDADTAAEYNAALPGAKKEGDFIRYQKNSGSLQKNVGDIKDASVNPQIVLHIHLADGTEYTAILANCKDSSSNYIDEWVRGKSYVYTIALGKEEVSFRALVKDWDEKIGSGNATLDWD